VGTPPVRGRFGPNTGQKRACRGYAANRVIAPTVPDDGNAADWLDKKPPQYLPGEGGIPAIDHHVPETCDICCHSQSHVRKPRFIELVLQITQVGFYCLYLPDALI